MASSTALNLLTEDLRSLFGQIEADLYQSEVYKKALAGIQATLGDMAHSGQALLNAIARKAIEVSLRRVMHYSQTSQPNPQPAPVALTPPAPPAYRQPVEKSALVLTQPPIPLQPSVPTKAAGKPARKPTKAELLAQERQERLQQLGREIHRLRQAKGLSMEKLHVVSLVPLHHLRALESGQVEHLPEDVYIRGFVRRIAQGLHVEGDRLLALLPNGDPVKGVLPSWKPLQSKSIHGFHPAYLYVGYATLMAGAVSGLNWLNQQALNVPLTNPLSEVPPTQLTHTKGSDLELQQAEFVSRTTIAPPEPLLPNR